MVVKSLSKITFDQFLDCFLLAFENYYVEMPTDRSYYKSRWEAAQVNFDFSYGMFDNETLVGFIIHAIDKRNGILTAYNAGTGVIPTYRGKRIIKSIYEFALKDLRKKEIQKSTLEVIATNEKAVMAYKSVGFEISKCYHCFSGQLQVDSSTAFRLEEVPMDHIDWNQLPNQNYYSWDYQKETLLRGKSLFFYVHNEREKVAFFVINESKTQLAQLDLLSSHEKDWNCLFSAINSLSTVLKMNNVDDRLSKKVVALKQAGLFNTIDQYEMELLLQSE